MTTFKSRLDRAKRVAEDVASFTTAELAEAMQELARAAARESLRATVEETVTLPAFEHAWDNGLRVDADIVEFARRILLKTAPAALAAHLRGCAA